MSQTKDNAPRRKICVVITARPSYSRIKTALAALEAHPGVDLQLVAAASTLLDRYGLAARTMEAEGLSIARRVYMVMEGENPLTMAKTTGVGIMELATVFDNLAPDAVVTVADRHETMATAVAASYMNIPLVHIQGGEVTGSIDDRVRHAITKLANLHLTATAGAARRLERMGEDPATVHVTGCPSIDLAAQALAEPAMDNDLFAKGVGPVLDISGGYIVVMQHPVTTEYAEARRQVTATLEAVHRAGAPTLWFWPNVDAGSDGTSKGIRAYREQQAPPNIHFFKGLPPLDFLRLLINSRGIVGNSSVGIRECSFLGVPAINIGSRQDGRERGPNVTDVPHDREAIAGALRVMLDSPRPPRDTLYGDGDAGGRIAELLATAPLTYQKRMVI